MAIATQQSQITVAGNAAATSFSFPFIAGSEDYIVVTFTDTDGTQTVLDPASYTLSINAPATGALWGVGGTVTYPLVGSPIANGTSLTIARNLTLTQLVSISNQGDFSPEVIEEALDILEMQIQQVSARSGAIRGEWATGIDYNYADIVIDGANGNDTGNFYICAIANTSDDWSDDLADGDWTLAFEAVDQGAFSTLTVTGATLFNLATAAFNLLTTTGTINIITTGAGGINLTTVTTGAIAITSSVTGALDNLAIGGNTPSTGVFTNFTANGTGNIDGIIIGANTAAAGTFTAFTASGTTTLFAGATFHAALLSAVAAMGLTLKRGANGRVGSFTLTGATAVTVNNTSIQTSDLVNFSLNTVAGTVGAIPSIKTITPAVGFTVSGTTADSSVYNYMITKSVV